MRPNRATDALEVGERHSRVPQTDRGLDQLLRMACTTEEGVIARHGKFAPPTLRRGVTHRKACGKPSPLLRHGGRIIRTDRRHGASPEIHGTHRVLSVLRWWVFRHVLARLSPRDPSDRT
jgi:hypothetical protein